MSIAIFGALTEEDIDIIRQGSFNIVQHDFFFCFFFFDVLSFFCSFLFFIRTTRGKRDGVNFLLPVTQISEVSQKYDYLLLIAPALIRFSKYEISIHRMDNYLKNTI